VFSRRRCGGLPARPASVLLPSTPPTGVQGQAPHARRTSRLLQPCASRDDLGVVPTTCRAEVRWRQEPHARSASKGHGRSQARDQTRLRQSRVGIHQDSRRLRGLKVEVGRTTVAAILAEAGLEPAPERRRHRSWKHFLRSHWETLYACDFFSVEVLGAFGTVRHLVFFVMHVQSRAVRIAGIQIAPDGAWMTQVARNLLDPDDGFLRGARFLIHDRDPLFTRAWTATLEASGVTCVPIPAQSPNCNAYAERFVGTRKRPAPR
jgi:hypothetical protein